MNKKKLSSENRAALVAALVDDQLDIAKCDCRLVAEDGVPATIEEIENFQHFVWVGSKKKKSIIREALFQNEIDWNRLF